MEGPAPATCKNIMNYKIGELSPASRGKNKSNRGPPRVGECLARRREMVKTQGVETPTNRDHATAPKSPASAINDGAKSPAAVQRDQAVKEKNQAIN